ncbi:uncharacterized protein LOC111631762 [Centruroides sculpturatus]|uniref:uncharacterized protein LOC111631762 n=1 Tax=Centruroides sculpturatus TaxID=218467 RepID=UPI000C6D616A|nr:uncharacterized protein LOC111631762 [Centruroides sculpturatus]
MIRHEELCVIVDQLNTRFSYLLMSIYVAIIFTTSFIYYSFLYLDVNDTFRFALLAALVLFVFVSIITSLLFCTFAFNMRNAFQDIRQFAICNFCMEEKLKILNFMKRFGKVSLCLTIGGIYPVTKRIPFKVASNLNSFFSAFMKLRGISKQESKCSNVTKWH